MSLMLIDPDDALVVELNLLPQALEALKAQWERSDDAKRSSLAKRFAHAISQVIETNVDWDLRPPSTAQIQYAIALAKINGVELPPEVLLQKRAMGMFLDQYAKPNK